MSDDLAGAKQPPAEKEQSARTVYPFQKIVRGKSTVIKTPDGEPEVAFVDFSPAPVDADVEVEDEVGEIPEPLPKAESARESADSSESPTAPEQSVSEITAQLEPEVPAPVKKAAAVKASGSRKANETS